MSPPRNGSDSASAFILENTYLLFAIEVCVQVSEPLVRYMRLIAFDGGDTIMLPSRM